jgi:hypothetical protein
MTKISDLGLLNYAMEAYLSVDFIYFPVDKFHHCIEKSVFGLPPVLLLPT